MSAKSVLGLAREHGIKEDEALVAFALGFAAAQKVALQFVFLHYGKYVSIKICIFAWSRVRGARLSQKHQRFKNLWGRRS